MTAGELRFDARAAWAALDDAHRQAIGEAALLLQLSTEACELAMDEGPTHASRRWERAEQVAWRRLAETVPMDADLYPDGPDLAAIDIRECRVCGCTDDDGCIEGCSWIGEDLCSACDAAGVTNG